MGRSAPTLRTAMRREIERLSRLARAEKDPEMRKALEELIGSGEGMLDAYFFDPPSDPMEIVLMSALVELFRRVSHLEKRKERSNGQRA